MLEFNQVNTVVTLGSLDRGLVSRIITWKNSNFCHGLSTPRFRSVLRRLVSHSALLPGDIVVIDVLHCHGDQYGGRLCEKDDLRHGVN